MAVRRNAFCLVAAIALVLTVGSRAHCEALQKFDLYSNFQTSIGDSGRKLMSYDAGRNLDERFSSTEYAVTDILVIDLPYHRKLKVVMSPPRFYSGEEFGKLFFFSDETLPDFTGRMLYLLKINAALATRQHEAAGLSNTTLQVSHRMALPLPHAGIPTFLGF